MIVLLFIVLQKLFYDVGGDSRASVAMRMNSNITAPRFAIRPM